MIQGWINGVTIILLDRSITILILVNVLIYFSQKNRKIFHISTPKMKIKTILSLLILSGLLPGLIPQAVWSNPRFPEASKQLPIAQIQRPSPNGSCLNYRSTFVEDCYQGVQWKKIPNSGAFLDSYNEGHVWVGLNTISRNVDAINFDFAGQGVYIRYSANCRTRVAAIVLASDSYVDPNDYSSVNEYVGQALDFACSVSN